MGIGDYVFLFLVLGFTLQARLFNSQNLTCNSNDLRALEGFMKGLESKIEGWVFNSSNCSTFPGVSWENSRVTGLKLATQRLKGNISESLTDLDHLTTLNLSRNFLHGPLPSKLFHMQKLQILDLSHNVFNGSIPTHTNLPSLRILDVTDNSFTGAITAGICDNSTQIRLLNFSTNHFFGNFPIGFGNCNTLERLSFSSNNLTGSLPPDLFLLKNLRSLHVQDNRISGSLSEGIHNLSNLVELDVSQNRFNGFLPDVFGSLLKLERLTVHSNKFIGTIPTSLSNLPSLQVLSLRNNSLNGSISLNCSAMVVLRSLDLGSNKFHGPFPDNLSFCRKLTAINLARNNLNSQIPESFKNLQSLTYLSLTRVGLSNINASLFVLQQIKSLNTIVLTGNFFHEVMPTDSDIQFENLTALVIANCNLTGPFPQWLRRSAKLQLLDLSLNLFDGPVPDWLGSMKFLFYLDVSNNNLSGEIPSNLTQLESLIHGNITYEEPSPDFPFYIRRNVSAKEGLQYNQIMSFPPSLDLSYNRLTGRISPEFANLKKLYVFNLKSNGLSGSIPSELSGMESLTTLDLSNNNLSGTIPLSLTNLSFLSKFSVAYNNLSGKVPSGGQFQTFSSLNFEGNSDLCDDRFTPCKEDRNSSNHVIPASHSKAKRTKAIIIGVAVGTGSGTLFLLILIFLIVKRTHSHVQVDTGKEKSDIFDKDMDVSDLGSVVLFEEEDNKELFIEDLLKSTNNFDQANIIGCGGFGLVYKATLPDGKKVAIKRLSGDCGQVDREFQAEVEALSRAQHENLVLLQGYCTCKKDRLLIYSYMENGSLDYWLHEKLDDTCSLDWETRLRIAKGAARGLAYLHLSCEPHILHRDVKSSNILLDENFEAHLADFGLARLILPYDTHVSTDLVGTLGYIPPEYGQASVATFKGDIYSFGVVLLELVTGKRPMDMCKPKERRNLISWVLQMRKEKKEAEVIDPFIFDKKHDKQILRVLEIACLCLSESPKSRPSTQQMVTWLESIDVNGY